MNNDTPVSQRRRTARSIILQVIEDNVIGPVQTLPKGDVLLLRRKLREAYPWDERKGWSYKVWCDEVRVAIGFAPSISRRKKKVRAFQPEMVMPSMTGWAKERGLLREADASPKTSAIRESPQLPLRF